MQFSTELIPASERSHAWLRQARQICGDCRIELSRIKAFHGSIETRSVGRLKLTQFSSSPLSFWKWPSDNTHSDQHSFIVISQLRGARRYFQAGEVVLLKPGDSTLIDSAQPWSSQCETDCARLYLRVPQWRIDDRLQTIHFPVAQRISGNTSIGAALFHINLLLYEQAAFRSTSEEAAAAVDACLDILCDCLARPSWDDRVLPGSQAFSRIQLFIEENLAAPELSPTSISTSTGVSLRHLHRLFSARGHSVNEWIRVRRLERCRRDLADCRLRDRTITEIAFFWGFCDSAHFSRLFRKQFGMSPRSFRASAGIRCVHEPELDTELLSAGGLRFS